MQLYAPNELPSLIQGRVCRQSRWMSGLGLLVMIAMLVVLPAYVVWTAQLSLWIIIPMLVVDSLVLKLLGGAALNAFCSENWLLRIAPDGLWINLRSHHNRKFAPASTVLFVPYQEIASVGEQSVKRSESHGGQTTMWTDRYLDVSLVDPAPPEIDAEISEERRRRVNRSHLGGFITSRGRNNHVPVTMPRDNVLRLAWRGRFDFIVPSLATTLRELSAECTVDEPQLKEVANLKRLSNEEVDAVILERVEQGDKLGAVKLLRDERGYGLTEAKLFVDELTVRL